MYVQHLSVADFRSWQRADVAFEPGVSVLVGANGEGKTNLLEAIGYLATLSSHRVAADAPLIRAGADQAVVQAAVVSEPAGSWCWRSRSRPAGRTGPSSTGRRCPGRGICWAACARCCSRRRTWRSCAATRPSAAGSSTTCWCSGRPGSPASGPTTTGCSSSGPRCSRPPAWLAGPAAAATCAPWTSGTATWPSTARSCWSARLELVRTLAPYAVQAYGQLAPASGKLGLRYVSSIDDDEGNDTGVIPSVSAAQEALLAALARVRPAELERGVTLVGPHRDELEISLNDLPVRGYASHGEGWSAALALRLACYELLAADGARAGADPG